MAASSSNMAHAGGHRSGYVTLIGKPNVGKSTLLNALLRRKLSIVTPKAQTTRHRVLGILTDTQSQIIFLDTPGTIKPRYRLHDAMMRALSAAVADADLLLFLADSRADDPDTLSLRHAATRPAILAINKIDLIRQEDALPLVERYLALRAFEAVVPISARTGFNLDALLHEIRARMPHGAQYYPPDMLSEHPERFFVGEIIREKVFERFSHEVPYSVAVQVTRYEERAGAKDYIEADIIVERDSQKGILIGSGGRALKRAGTAARKDIEAFIGGGVYLTLRVKVRPNWRNRDNLLRSYGYPT